MNEAQWSAITLIVIGVGVTTVFLADYNGPGNLAIPARTTKPVAYWGNVVFFAATALFGVYGLLVGF